ncbi:MAG: hypothetical protein WAV09_02290 [Minisyncoccia bacterium]
MFVRPYFLTIILSIALFFAHRYADIHDSYFAYRWLDIPMHVFGGFVVALLGVCLLAFFRRKIEKPVFSLLVVLFVLVVGALWEIFELSVNVMYHIRTTNLTHIQDTIFDLINDVIGALAALYVAYKKHWYE